MTNDELKKKILSIVRGAMLEADELPFIETTDNIADALIAAGIGDVKEAELRAEVAESELERYTALIKPLEDENAQLKHRAEVAERALNKFAENVTCEDCPFFSDCSSLEKMKDSVHPNYCYAEYLRQAEKKLAEEKDD